MQRILVLRVRGVCYESHTVPARLRGGPPGVTVHLSLGAGSAESSPQSPFPRACRGPWLSGVLACEQGGHRRVTLRPEVEVEAEAWGRDSCGGRTHGQSGGQVGDPTA